MDNNNHIYEMPIYDGALKNWRVLNLMSGTFYSNNYENFEDAYNSIINGEKRGTANRQGDHYIVKRITIPELNERLSCSAQ